MVCNTLDPYLIDMSNKSNNKIMVTIFTYLLESALFKQLRLQHSLLEQYSDYAAENRLNRMRFEARIEVFMEFQYSKYSTNPD